MQTAACTIVSNNYLHFARTLARSFQAHHPQGRFFALIVDHPAPGIDYDTLPFECRFAERIGIRSFRNMAFRYDVLELNTAVKPFWLSYLHREQGLSQVCYFDPDILILRNLDDLFQRLEECDLLLTPHITKPIDDRRHPSERDLLTAGVYNLGFVGVAFRRPSLELLDWWGDRLHRHGVNRAEQGLFVDQKWMDLAPALVPKTEILHEAGLNIAYWNLQQRALKQVGETWCIEGDAAGFVHFSGLDPGNLDPISKHQDRLTLAELPHLRPLFEDYALRLRREGLEAYADVPYAYGRFDNGSPIPVCIRRTLQDLDPEGCRWPDPFLTRPDSFFEWLRQPSHGLLSLPRAALSLWNHVPECRVRFPLDDPQDWADFGGWVAAEAEAHGLSEALLEPLRLEGSSEAEGARTKKLRSTAAQLDAILGEADPGPALRWWIENLGTAKFLWLESDAGLEPARPLVSRLAIAIHRRRADLWDLFPAPLATSRQAFCQWLVTHGRREYCLAPQAIGPVLASMTLIERLKALLWWRLRGAPGTPSVVQGIPQPAAARRKPEAWKFEVHIAGYGGEATGKGEELRGTLAAARSAGLSHCAWNLTTGQVIAEEERVRFLGISESPSLLLLHVNADATNAILRQLPPPLAAAPLKVGYWDWELEYFPMTWSDRFEGLTEIWAPSRFCQRAYSTLSPIPVRWVPLCAIPPEDLGSPRLGEGIAGDPFVFLCMFDVRSVPQRKNPEALLEAFRRLSSQARRPVHLILKLSHAAERPQYVESLVRRSEGLRVQFETRMLSRAGITSLMRGCDCYVSLHRSEGVGLPLIEAMYLARPVVVTDYSGSTDFLDEETGWPVRYHRLRLEEDCGPYPAGAVWADADPSHAAEQMLRVISDPEERERRGQAARERAWSLFSPEVAGRRFQGELRRLYESLPSHNRN